MCQPFDSMLVLDSVSLWIVCQLVNSVVWSLNSLLVCGQCVCEYGQCGSLMIECQSLENVLFCGQSVSLLVVCQPLDSVLVMDSVLAFGQFVSLWIVCQSVFSLGRRRRSRNHVFYELGFSHSIRTTKKCCQYVENTTSPALNTKRHHPGGPQIAIGCQDSHPCTSYVCILKKTTQSTTGNKERFKVREGGIIHKGPRMPFECQAFSALLGKYARHADNRGPSYLGALHALRSSHTSRPFTSMPGIHLHILVHYGRYAY